MLPFLSVLPQYIAISAASICPSLFPFSSMSAPTPEENMHLISYAQCLLKIVFLWWKVRTKFTGTQWVFFFSFFSLSSKLLLSCLLSRSILLPENHSICPQNESATERHREGGYLSRFERLIWCHRNKLYHIVLSSVLFFPAGFCVAVKRMVWSDSYLTY